MSTPKVETLRNVSIGANEGMQINLHLKGENLDDDAKALLKLAFPTELGFSHVDTVELKKFEADRSVAQSRMELAGGYGGVNATKTVGVKTAWVVFPEISTDFTYGKDASIESSNFLQRTAAKLFEIITESEQRKMLDAVIPEDKYAQFVKERMEFAREKLAVDVLEKSYGSDAVAPLKAAIDKKEIKDNLIEGFKSGIVSRVENLEHELKTNTGLASTIKTISVESDAQPIFKQDFGGTASRLKGILITTENKKQRDTLKLQ